MIYFETARLRFRDWKEADIIPFTEMNADNEVMKYFPKTLSADESYEFYEAIVSKFHDYGFGFYAVEEMERNEFIGFIGFHEATFEADFTPCIEIGWRLKKEVWGKGYATEGAEACLHYGFTELGFHDVFSFTAEINTPSQNVMRKIGMDFTTYFDHPKLPIESPLRRHVLYHIKQKSSE